MSNNLLYGKKGVIFGALNSHSIAWKVAEKAVEQGAEIVLSNTETASRMGDIDLLGKQLGAKVILADATNVEELTNVFQQAVEVFGGKIDFVLHSIGMSPNVRKGNSYDDLNYSYLNKTLDVSAISFHKMMQVMKKLDCLNDNASILALTHIAAQRTFPGYGDMADAKALLESICRSFGSIYGREKGVRVNTISQSPLLTTAGQGIEGIEGFCKFAQKMSPLGNASAEECAEYCVVMFSDFTRKVTMQNLYHDGGFSSMGLTREIVEEYIDK